MDMDHPLRVLHLEHDGKVLLVDEGGNGPRQAVKGRVIESPTLRFPTPDEVSAMGIEWTVKRTVSLEDVLPDVHVDFGYPSIAWPSQWPWKDDLISDNAVHPVARESVYRTIHRVVSKVIVTDADGMVLMGRVARGHFVGMWTLPGGYLDHDEHPAAGCVREAMEEFGLSIHLSDTAPVVTQRVFDERGLSFLSFTYTARSTTRPEVTVETSEIAEAGWFTPSEAMSRAVSHFDATALRAHLDRS